MPMQSIELEQKEFEKRLSFDLEKNIEVEKNVEFSNTNIFKRMCRFISIIALSILHGYNHVSANNVINTSKTLYANDFTENHEDFATTLPPTFFYIGGLLGIIFMFNKNYINFNKVLMICSICIIIPYAATMSYPHIYMVYFMKIIIGFISAIMSLLLPQIFHSLGSGNGKNFMTALFPCFLLGGIAMSVSFIQFSVEHYYFINFIPILLASIGLVSLIFSTSYNQEKADDVEDGSKVGLYKFLTNPKTIKSALLIVIVQLAYRMTGVDFIGLFSNTLFEGEYANLLQLLPFVIPIVLMAISDRIANYFGRKITYVFGLFMVASACFFFFFYEINAGTLIYYSGCLNLFCSVIPYAIPIEIVEPGYQSIANELSCFMIYGLSILVSLYIALTFVKGSTAVWFTFGAATLVLAVVLLFFMVESLNLESAYHFVEKYNNISSFKKIKCFNRESTLEFD